MNSTMTNETNVTIFEAKVIVFDESLSFLAGFCAIVCSITGILGFSLI